MLKKKGRERDMRTVVLWLCQWWVKIAKGFKWPVLNYHWVNYKHIYILVSCLQHATWHNAKYLELRWMKQNSLRKSCLLGHACLLILSFCITHPFSLYLLPNAVLLYAELCPSTAFRPNHFSLFPTLWPRALTWMKVNGPELIST